MNTMNNIWSFLKGKKSYIVAFLIGVVAMATSLGWIQPETALTFYGLLGAGGVASLRHGINSK